MLRFGRAPNDLLEYSDVKLCPNAGETKELERLPPKVKFLLIIGAAPTVHALEHYQSASRQSG